MFKKAISTLLVLGICLLLMTSCSENGANSDPFMGDVNGDGALNNADLTLFNDYLDGEATEIRYEFCDLDGNFKVDAEDAKILEKYLNGKGSALKGTPFGKADEDVTANLEDLSVNNIRKWNDLAIENITARNPYDMYTSNGLVMVAGGNSRDNKGPVIISGYSKGSTNAVDMGRLASEQINKFYDFGDFVATVSVDARTWQYGDVYVKSKTENKWASNLGVLKGNIHCYDMVKFGGKYFFCGSNVVYQEHDGLTTELGLASVFVYDGELSKKMNQSDFKEVELIKNEKNINDDPGFYDTKIEGEIYKMQGLPRIYEFFKFNGKLYTFYFDQFSENYDEEHDYNGLYAYDEVSGNFVFDDSLNADFLCELMGSTVQDAEKIQHDFQWGDRYYFVKNGLYSTKDFKFYGKNVIPNYQGYDVHDVVFKGDFAYVLASKELQNGDFVNVVLETKDFVNFRTLFHFETKLFARSFEFCNGEFYFGLGFAVTNVTNGEINDRNKECGRILRYSYYK
ncbi:MAG: dockerin type I repeat-containing protein [Clostridia bacterium]|nr:dockerin type I repeat-containing protein [Clostridia bacterium]